MHRSHAPRRLIATLVTALMATLTLVAVNAPAAQAAEPANAIRAGFNTTNVGASDDGSYPCTATTGCTPTAVPLGFSINFYGSTWNSVFINNNGNLTLGSSLADYSPPPLASSVPPIIAPFFADVDTRSGNTAKFGTGTVDGRPAFGVTWSLVRCYALTTPLNSFQVILVDRSDIAPGAFDVEYNYNQVVWNAGTASGGGASNCVGNTSAARIGFAKGGGTVGTTYELAGSGTNNTIDGASQSLTGHSLNSTTLGRYFFTFRDGSPSNVNKISTKLTAGSSTADSLTANVGTPVTLSSTMTGVTANAGGTVTYRVYSNNVCSTAVGNAQTATVTNGVVGSTTALNLAAGTYYIQASYSGDSANPATATICGANVLTVATNVVTITANNQTKNLGAADPTFTYTVAGLQNGDTLTSTPTCGVSGTHTDAGAYNIVCTGGTANASKYTVARINGTLTVNKGNAIVTAANKTKVYGAATPAATFTTTGLVTGFPLTTQPTCAITPGENVGSYAITCSGASSPNYNVTYVPGSLTIVPAPATVKADPKTKTYGSPDPAFTSTVSGLVNGDSLTPTPTCGVPAEHSHVGTYDILCTGPTSGVYSNYNITYVKSTLTVNRAGVTVTADPSSHEYGQDDAPFTATVGGLQPGDSLGFTPTCTVAGAHRNAGQYPITCSGPATSGDYTVTYVPGTLTVTKKALTLVPGNRSITYGDAEPDYGYTVSGLVGDDTLATAATCGVSGPHRNVGSYDIVCTGAQPGPNYTLDDSATGTLTVTPAVATVVARNYTVAYGTGGPQPGYDVTGLRGDDTLVHDPTCSVESPHSDAGEYRVSCTGADAGDNYTVTYLDGTWTVLPVDVYVISDPAHKTYGQPDPAFTATTFGLIGSDSFVTEPQCDVPAAHQHAGTYQVICSGADAGPNYRIHYTQSGQFTVSPALVTIKPQDRTRTYGSPEPTYPYTVSGLVGNESLITEPTCSAPPYPHDQVGQFPITCSGAVATSDYDLSYDTATLTNTPKNVTVTATPQTKTYGTADPTFTYQVSGLAGTDTLVTEPACGVDGEHSNVGDYPIVCTGADGGNNYTVTTVPSTLHVTPATLTLTAENKTKVYAAADPEFTFTTDGLVGDDQLTSQPVCGVNGPHRNVGSYDITCTGGGAGSNYTVVRRPGTLSVTRAAVLITADNQSKVYGTADPEFTYQVSGLADGEQLLTAPTCAPSGAHRNVGNYDIVCSGAEGGGNYAVTYAPGTLKVTKATVTVAAENKTKVYGAEDPAFTRTVTGLVGDDTLVAAGSCGVTGAHSNVGNYPITCSGADAGGNYDVVHLPGTLTVTKAAVAITAENKTKVYGTADPEFTWTVGGLVGEDGLATPPTCTVSGPHHNVGSYPITCSGATTSGNYDISYTAGTLTVTKAAVRIAADNQSKVYGTSDPQFTWTTEGLVGGDQLTTDPTCGVAGAHSNVGSYPITCSGASAGDNYTVSYAPGTLTVTRGQVVVTADNQSKVYGTADPAFTYAVTGLVGNDSFTTPPSCTVAGAHSNVGTYPITCSGADAGTNYSVKYLPGTLTVTQATLTLSADNKAKVYGTADPQFTYTAAGLVGNDTLTAQPTCTVTGAHNNVGSYPITCTGGSAGSNYTVVRNPGTLVVTKATPVLLTQPSPDVPVGGKVWNTATLVTGSGTAGGDVTFRLYGPDDASCTTLAGTVGGTRSGNTVTSAKITVNQAGTYRWRVSYAGDANTEPITSPCGDLVKVTPQVLGGRAYGVSATASVLGLPLSVVAPTPDTGYVSTTSSGTVTKPCVNLTGLVSATALCTSVVTTASPNAKSVASAAVTDVNIGLPLLPVVAIKGIQSSSTTTCAGSTGTVKIASITVGGTNVFVNVNATPNTVINVAGVQLILNQQVQTPTGLQVNAVVVKAAALTSSVNATIASTESSVSNCP